MDLAALVSMAVLALAGCSHETPKAAPAPTSITRSPSTSAQHDDKSRAVSYHGLRIDVPEDFRVTTTPSCEEALTMVVVVVTSRGTCLGRVTGVPVMPLTKSHDYVVLDRFDGPQPSGSERRQLNGLDVFESQHKSAGGAIEGVVIDVPSLGVAVGAQGHDAVQIPQSAHPG